ncbi:MAG: long-chain fatty acid--CoA ligase [Gammaproteobacteria bacterium]|nr:long-chain fatty acid--CoA ligase [Gammaproteobacteria bacterium]
MIGSIHISLQRAGTLDGLFRERVHQTPQWEAYTSYDCAQQTWTTLCWQHMAEQVGRWQAALAPTGLQQGDRFGILLRNCPEWVAAEQAALGLGLVVVPLYLEDRPDNIRYIVQDAGIKALVVPNAACWENIHAAHPQPLTDLHLVVLAEGETAPPAPWQHTRVQCLKHWLPLQAIALSPREGDPHSLATIVYTSGTTGKPKGVMLSHHNILSIAEESGKILELQPRWRLLSFLPLSHTFERTGGYYIPMMFGLQVIYSRSISLLGEDLQAIQPQVLIAVPRIFERFYEKIHDYLRTAHWITRGLYRLTVHVGWQEFLAQQGRAKPKPYRWLWPWLKRRVADKITARLGGKLAVAVSGGAPLPFPVARMFIGLGLNLLQGYGLTESSPVITANRRTNNDPSSVGLPLDGVEVRLGDNDELQARSPGIMLGYWNNPTATHAALTEDGWLRTGDKARIHHGRIYITGRIKDILVLSNGEKIPPADMEAAITFDPLFAQALIIGEARSYLAALVVLNAEPWYPFAQSQGVNPRDPRALQAPQIHLALLDRIANALREFPGYAKVRRVTPLLEPWTVENGLLTPTLKTKRQLIVQRWSEQVEGMYS